MTVKKRGGYLPKILARKVGLLSREDALLVGRSPGPWGGEKKKRFRSSKKESERAPAKTTTMGWESQKGDVTLTKRKISTSTNSSFSSERRKPPEFSRGGKKTVLLLKKKGAGGVFERRKGKERKKPTR